MADTKETKRNDEEKKIPVFTVLKNNAILKNIFLLDNNASSISDSKSITSVEKPGVSDQETEQILTVGRHPDCNIMLTHPSISRFHLRIHSSPSSQTLSVTDLSSVHGTWISGMKMEPEVPIELKEGDSIGMGASSRVYRLHWIPLSRAYDLENPFVSPSDMLISEENEEEIGKSEGDEGDETCQDDGSLLGKNKQLLLLNSISEVVDSQFSDENLDSFVKREVPSAPPMPENLCDLFLDEEEILNQSPLEVDHIERENLSLYHGPNASESVKSFLPVGEPFMDNENENFDKENQFAQPVVVTEVLSARESSPERTLEHKSILSDRLNSSFVDDGEDCPVVEVTGHMESESPAQKEYKGRDWSGTLEIESMNLSLPSRSVLFEIENQQSRSPKPLYATEGLSEKEDFTSPPIRSEQNSNLPNIWSRRGKPASILQIQTGSSKAKSRLGTDIGGKPKTKEDAELSTISKALFSDLDTDEDETFTPNKENLTSDARSLRSSKRKGKQDEVKHSMSYRLSSSKVAVSPSISPGEDIFANSDKENWTPKVLQERKSVRSTSVNRVRLEQKIISAERGAERMPFRSILVNYNGKSKSEASVFNATAKSSTPVDSVQCIDTSSNLCNNADGAGRRKWYMVADASCLLNRESMKALQLLQGLRGTQLIIPSMVLRELNCLKRRGSLFRRKTEVSSALEWIEECMVNTKWWIHVQSSLEEGRSVAPTPPAAPHAQFSEGSEGIFSTTTSLVPFFVWGSLMDIVSPTAEDHILESALLYRRLKNDGQLVLLSNNVTLKIKAMAEGMVCESAEEFRESLVNPFSERFLWDESSPRGQTWSCLDDEVLRERYYGCPLKKTSKGEGTKGLKLILLHNTYYGHKRIVN